MRALRWLAWALILAAAAALYLFDNNTGTRALLLAAIILPPLSGLFLLLPRRKIEVRLEKNGSFSRGEPGELTLRFENTSPFPALLRGKVTLRNQFTGESRAVPLDLRAGREAAFPLTVTFRHSGQMAVELTELRETECFGLFSRKLPEKSWAVLVPPCAYPAEVELRPAEAPEDAVCYAAERPGNDPSETFQIRDYAPGDPLRRIHWKLSEKLDKTLVRDYGLPEEDRVQVFLDAPEPVTGEAADALADTLLSLGQALLRRETPFSVGTTAVDTPEDLAALLETLLSAPASSLRFDGETPAGCTHGLVLGTAQSQLPAGCRLPLYVSGTAGFVL